MSCGTSETRTRKPLASALLPQLDDGISLAGARKGANSSSFQYGTVVLQTCVGVELVRHGRMAAGCSKFALPFRRVAGQGNGDRGRCWPTGSFKWRGSRACLRPLEMSKGVSRAGLEYGCGVRGHALCRQDFRP